MTLRELIERLPDAEVHGTPAGEVRGVTDDSRAVGAGDVFVAVRGYEHDGNRFSEAAVRAGAAAVVTDAPGALPAGTVGIVVSSARRALGILAAAATGDPARALAMTGVTGTNGKTSVATMLQAVLADAGIRTGLIGTIAYDTGDGTVPAARTTPGAAELQGLLARMRGNGCSAAVMEVSSHALELERVAGIGYGCTVFTNLSRDHLDFHGTEDVYGAAKMRLFSTYMNPDGTAVVNTDDPWGARMAAAAAGRTVSYGIGAGADLRADDISMDISGTRFTLRTPDGALPVELRVLGMFNVYNTLAAVGAARANGIGLHEAVKSLERFPGVRGRFEPVRSVDGFTAVIDYAHTPDALRKVLETARAVCGGRVICVMGCGGDRDRGKRPQMGTIAAELADLTVVTSDNPRTEDPDAIISDIMAGIPDRTGVTVEPDRRQAIACALEQARTGDMVVVAGKGHEDYQILGTGTIHFDDRETVEALLAGGTGV